MASFLFSRPQYIPELSEKANVVCAIGLLSERLTNEKRTRTYHYDGRLENVAEHSLMLVKVAVRLAELYYPELNTGKIAIFAADHDDVEAYVGDMPTDSRSHADFKDKKHREERGLTQLIQEYQPLIPGYAFTVETYEQQLDLEARFVRMVDKVIVAITHFVNDGRVFIHDYNFDEFVSFEINRANTWSKEYPEFTDIIGIRTELAMYLARKYLK